VDFAIALEALRKTQRRKDRHPAFSSGRNHRSKRQ
jgi:hypothetical protein